MKWKVNFHLFVFAFVTSSVFANEELKSVPAVSHGAGLAGEEPGRPLLAAPKLSDAELLQVAEKVAKNEFEGDPNNIVMWNDGENFPSLGIGHYLWFPRDPKTNKKIETPFEESFPQMIKFMAENGYPTSKFPRILQYNPLTKKIADNSPWDSQALFKAAAKRGELDELRRFLHDPAVRRLQVKFQMSRLKRAADRMQLSLPPQEAIAVGAFTKNLLNSSRGTFAAIDYVNFKGDGENKNERYRGQGWGLQQVIMAAAQDMSPPKKSETPEEMALRKFKEHSLILLEKRVSHAPSEDQSVKERHWFEGAWSNRVNSY